MPTPPPPRSTRLVQDGKHWFFLLRDASPPVVADLEAPYPEDPAPSAGAPAHGVQFDFSPARKSGQALPEL